MPCTKSSSFTVCPLAQNYFEQYYEYNVLVNFKIVILKKGCAHYTACVCFETSCIQSVKDMCINPYTLNSLNICLKTLKF